MNKLIVLVVIAASAVVFFSSSRRRHTSLQGDWRSDVCSSDLICRSCTPGPYMSRIDCGSRWTSKRSEERRVGKSVDLGGRRIIKKKNKNNENGRRNAEEEEAQNVRQWAAMR